MLLSLLQYRLCCSVLHSKLLLSKDDYVSLRSILIMINTSRNKVPNNLPKNHCFLYAGYFSIAGLNYNLSLILMRAVLPLGAQAGLESDGTPEK